MVYLQPAGTALAPDAMHIIVVDRATSISGVALALRPADIARAWLAALVALERNRRLAAGAGGC